MLQNKPNSNSFETWAEIKGFGNMCFNKVRETKEIVKTQMEADIGKTIGRPSIKFNP